MYTNSIYLILIIMKCVILIILLTSSTFTICQNFRSPEEVEYFNKEFIRLINIERKKLNLDTLIESEELSNKSMNWSRECISKSKYEHSKVDDADAECMDLIFGKFTIESAVTKTIQAFKGSPAHWKILMDKSYSKIGVGEYKNKIINQYRQSNSNLPMYHTASIVTVKLK